MSVARMHLKNGKSCNKYTSKLDIRIEGKKNMMINISNDDGANNKYNKILNGP